MNALRASLLAVDGYADQQIRRGGKLWSTEVFLFVPDQGFIRSHRHPGVTHLNPNNILDQNSVPENSIGGSFPIAMPKPLEEKDITKFKRAFLKLGITAMAPTFTASSTRKLPETGEEQDSGDGSGSDEAWPPKLRLLTNATISG